MLVSRKPTVPRNGVEMHIDAGKADFGGCRRVGADSWHSYMSFRLLTGL